VMRDHAEQRLAALRRDYDDGQARLLQLEHQSSALRETLLRISGAIQILEELLAKQEPHDQHQPNAETSHVP
jgi:hypothetical protein